MNTQGPRISKLNQVSRREFIATTAVAGTVLATSPSLLAQSAPRRRRYALVGVGSRSGMYRRAVCDTYKEHCEMVGYCDNNLGRLQLAQSRDRPPKEAIRARLTRDRAEDLAHDLARGPHRVPAECLFLLADHEVKAVERLVRDVALDAGLFLLDQAEGESLPGDGVVLLREVHPVGGPLHHGKEALRELQTARALLASDLAQVVPRGVQEADGRFRPRFLGGDADTALAFTRAAAEPDAEAGANTSLAFVEYVIDGEGRVLRRRRRCRRGVAARAACCWRTGVRSRA